MAEQAHILVVDDERATRVTLAEILELEGYQVTAVGSGQEAIARLEKESFDLVLTDLRMPDVDGTQVIEAARRLAPRTVVILLTAYGTLDSALHALRHGAHDYLLKPARAAQIIESVQNGLRKRQSAAGEPAPEPAPEPPLQPETRFLEVHGLTVDRYARSVTAGGQPVELTRVEYELLVLLMSKADQVLPCTDILREVQGYQADDSEARAIVRVHVSRLRQKLEQAGAGKLPIVNVRGIGYRLSK